MKIYIHAKSKADINRRLKSGEQLSGYSYAMFGGGGGWYDLQDVEDGTIVAVFEKTSGGNPVAKAWGTWDSKKQQLK
jgi:hypothetical protein